MSPFPLSVTLRRVSSLEALDTYEGQQRKRPALRHRRETDPIAPTTRREIEEDTTLALNFLSGPIRSFSNMTASKPVLQSRALCLHDELPTISSRFAKNLSVPDENSQGNEVPEQPVPAEGGADKVAPAADKVSHQEVSQAMAARIAELQGILGRASGE